MILLVSSEQDVASRNIARQILSHYHFDETAQNFQGNPVYKTSSGAKEVELIALNGESIYAQNLTDFHPAPDLVVFVSRHSSLSGIPTLSVHTPGNFGEAEQGGLPRKLSMAPADAKRDVLRNMAQLRKEMQLDYEVSYECTHHGPSLDAPTMFAELGSSPEQWNDLRAAEAVAHSVMKAIVSFGQSQAKIVIGIGGPHYNAKFTRLALESQVAFGHIIPKYAVPNVDSEILKLCVEKTSGQVQCAILDWKGIKGECKTPLIRMLDDIGLPFEKT